MHLELIDVASPDRSSWSIELPTSTPLFEVVALMYWFQCSCEFTTGDFVRLIPSVVGVQMPRGPDLVAFYEGWGGEPIRRALAFV